jgi:hypothetical protein
MRDRIAWRLYGLAWRFTRPQDRTFMVSVLAERARRDAAPADNGPTIHLYERCPDCGKSGAHHSYENRAGERAGVRCG